MVFGKAVQSVVSESTQDEDELISAYKEYCANDSYSYFWRRESVGAATHGWEPVESFSEWKEIEASGGSHQGFDGPCSSAGIQNSSSYD